MAGEESAEGFGVTLNAILESQRRIEQQLEEVWRATATRECRGIRRGAGDGAVLAGEQRRAEEWVSYQQDKDDDYDDEEMVEQGKNKASHVSEATEQSLTGAGAHDDVAWSLPEAWPSNLQAKSFGQPTSAPSSSMVKTGSMVRIFTEAVSDPIGRLEGYTGHSVLGQGVAADLADLNLRAAHEKMLLNPHGQVRLIFDVASCVFLLYDLAGLPIILAWDVPVTGTIWRIALCIDLFWVADLVLNFFTGYYHGGVLIMEPVSVAKHYAKSWLLPDLAILAVSATSLWLADDVGIAETTKLKFARFAKMARLLRIVTVARVIHMSAVFEKLSDRAQGVSLSEMLEAPGLVFLIVFINHAMACTWFAIGQSSFSDTGMSWLQTPLEGGAETYETACMLYQYLSSLHWSLTQMTPGSNQINPVNSIERAFTVLCLLSGMVFFGSIVSSLTATLTKQRLQRQEKAKELKTLRRVLRQNMIPTPLVVAAQKQGLERLAARRKHIVADVRSMSFLAETMRTRLHYELCAKYLLHPLFRWWEVVDTDSVQRLCHKGIDRLYLQRHDSLFHAGSKATSAYIVASGKLMYSQERQTARVSDRVEKLVHIGDWLCEAVLWAEWVHVGHAEAVCGSEVMSVNADQFKQAVESSRVSMFVFQDYGAAFHARILSAQPPRSQYPTDLEVPCCSFEEIVPSLPLRVRQVISGAAFRQLRLSSSRFWMRPNLIRDLAKQVQDGKCTLALSAEKDIERIVAIVTLKLRQPDETFLVELLDKKGGSCSVECKLPGTKQREGETPDQTISRIAQTLEPCTDGMVWSSRGYIAERICKTTAANIRLVYFCQTYGALVDPEFQSSKARTVHMEGLPSGLIVLKDDNQEDPSDFVESGHSVKSVQSTITSDSLEFSQVNFKAYAWLSESEFEYFKSDRGRKHLNASFQDVQADLLAAAAEEERLSI